MTMKKNNNKVNLLNGPNESLGSFNNSVVVAFSGGVDSSVSALILKNKGFNVKKDQSYFLWKLNSKTLKKVIFPLGGMTKEDVKEIAKKNKLPVSKKESQEVCFIKETNNEFLKKYIKEKEGDIINKEGSIVGKHKGVWFYTIGQRRGIGLSGGPYWVIGKDVKRNKLIVSSNEKDLFSKEVSFKNANWIRKVDFPLKVKAKIRYGHKGDFGVLNNNKLVFDRPQKAITSGQSIVFYNKSEVIGGGIIK
ncbi:MAG: tRNA-specific 2-thiouridylase MnmA [Parcubacteria bacterium 34_609]|nr:MAG: tRNA-specific 2-thiouridylase MnmA [Parcubacteria bacterium 34_609]